MIALAAFASPKAAGTSWPAWAITPTAVTSRLVRRVRPPKSLYSWQSLERAERLTKCGIFLFMEDDELRGRNGAQRAPRDNVIYEAGYFAGAKGRAQTLIVRERAAKIPTDLDGVIYVLLENRKSVRAILPKIRSIIEKMLR